MIESSFIIPAWYTKNQVGKEHPHEVLWWAHVCIKRVLEVTPMEKVEIIMVDNASEKFSTINDDGKVISTEGYFKHADILVTHKENMYYGGGMNAGIAIASGKYIFCLECDVLPFPGWYEELIKTFTMDGLEHKPGLVQPWSIGCLGMRRARDLIKYDDPNLIYKGKRTIEWGKEWGAAHVTPKKIFDELVEKDGFVFDPRFIQGKEDKDLYKRIRLLGYETCRNYKSVVYHNTATSSSKLPGHKEIHEENKKKFNEKWNI